MGSLEEEEDLLELLDSLPLWGEEGAPRKPQVFFEVFSPYSISQFLPTRQAQGGDLAATPLKKHPGQGSSLLQAAGGRERTDWVIGCHTLC